MVKSSYGSPGMKTKDGSVREITEKTYCRQCKGNKRKVYVHELEERKRKRGMRIRDNKPDPTRSTEPYGVPLSEMQMT